MSDITVLITQKPVSESLLELCPNKNSHPTASSASAVCYRNLGTTFRHQNKLDAAVRWLQEVTRNIVATPSSPHTPLCGSHLRFMCRVLCSTPSRRLTFSLLTEVQTTH